jgi:hypothetical protein
MSAHATNKMVVVMRGPSAVVFEPGSKLRVEGFPSEIGPVDIVYTSRYISRGSDIRVPGHLWIHVEGPAPTLRDALDPFANAGLAMLPVLALSANAAIKEPDVEVAFDNSPGIVERDYFQTYMPPEPDVVYLGRLMDVESTVAGPGAGEPPGRRTLASRSWPVVKYLRGKLIGPADRLAEPGNEYPFMRWKPEVKSFRITEERKAEYSLTETITAELGEGVQFQPQSIEAWRAE